MTCIVDVEVNILKAMVMPNPPDASVGLMESQTQHDEGRDTLKDSGRRSGFLVEPSRGAVAKESPAVIPDESPEPDALDTVLGEMFDALPSDARRKQLEKQAGAMASLVASEEVGRVLKESGKSLRTIQAESGLDPATISRVVTGHRESGPKLSTIMAIALALGKNVTLKIE